MPTHTFSTIQLSGWSSGRGRLGHATWNCMESDVTGAACHRAAHWYCAWRSSIAGLIARGTYWWHAATRHRYLLPPPHLMPFQWPAALDIPEYLPSALLLQTGLGEETSTGLGVPLRWPRLFAATPAAAAPSRNRRVSIRRSARARRNAAIRELLPINEWEVCSSPFALPLKSAS